jgi:REP element-mobilizing transposase RayT
MPYNPTLHRRRSIRLKGYDYSSQGAYFVTLCAQNREHFFGHIDDGTLCLNDAGQMVERWYDEVGRKFPVVECGEMVVMPNHFHCIWHITKLDADTNIPTVVQWFKTMTTNEYIRGVKGLGWSPFNKRLWQRNYFERIIRNEQAYENIRRYIQTNPERWESDQLRGNGSPLVGADLRVCPYDHDIRTDYGAVHGADDIGADT